MMRQFTRRDICLLAFVFVMALSLRGPVVGIAPLINLIENDLHLSSSASGLLSTLPLLAFALFAPVATFITRRIGLEATLLAGAVCIFSGELLRAWTSLNSLYSGAVMIGIGIAIGNVLLPVLLKRDFPKHILQLTALYVLMMNLGGAFMTGFAVPIQQWVDNASIGIPGWPAALASQVIFVIPALIIWIAIPKRTTQAAPITKVNSSVWRLPLAWLVTLFIAFGSILNYVVNAWIPSILIAKGFDPVTAGLYQSYLQTGGMLPALIMPFLKRWLINPRQITCLALVTTMLSLVGFAFMAEWSALWSAVFGFGCTLGFIMGLSLITMRTDSIHQAAALSGMASLIGYLLAAAGPVAIGALHDATQEWQTSLFSLIGVCGIWCVLGWFASPNTAHQ